MKKAIYEFTPDGKVAFRLVYHKVNSKRMKNLTPEDKKTLRDIVSRFESVLSELKKQIQ
jgi:hypothetical protein